MGARISPGFWRASFKSKFMAKKNTKGAFGSGGGKKKRFVEIPVAAKDLGPFLLKVLLTDDPDALDTAWTRTGEITECSSHIR
jgi:hypothetical protein